MVILRCKCTEMLGWYWCGTALCVPVEWGMPCIYRLCIMWCFVTGKGGQASSSLYTQTMNLVNDRGLWVPRFIKSMQIYSTWMSHMEKLCHLSVVISLWCPCISHPARPWPSRNSGGFTHAQIFQDRCLRTQIGKDAQVFHWRNLHYLQDIQRSKITDFLSSLTSSYFVNFVLLDPLIFQPPLPRRGLWTPELLPVLFWAHGAHVMLKVPRPRGWL